MLPAVSGSREQACPGETADPVVHRGGSPGAQRPGPSGTEVLLQPLPLQPELSADRDLAPPALLKHREPWPSLQRWAAWSQPRSPQQGCAPNLLPLGKECRQIGLWLRPPHCGPKDGACAFSEGYPNLNPKEEASYPLTTPKTLRTCPSPAKKRQVCEDPRLGHVALKEGPDSCSVSSAVDQGQWRLFSCLAGLMWGISRGKGPWCPQRQSDAHGYVAL